MVPKKTPNQGPQTKGPETNGWSGRAHSPGPPARAPGGSKTIVLIHASENGPRRLENKENGPEEVRERPFGTILKPSSDDAFRMLENGHFQP